MGKRGANANERNELLLLFSLVIIYLFIAIAINLTPALFLYKFVYLRVLPYDTNES